MIRTLLLRLDDWYINIYKYLTHTVYVYFLRNLNFVCNVADVKCNHFIIPFTVAFQLFWFYSIYSKDLTHVLISIHWRFLKCFTIWRPLDISWTWRNKSYFCQDCSVKNIESDLQLKCQHYRVTNVKSKWIETFFWYWQRLKLPLRDHISNCNWKYDFQTMSKKNFTL